MICKVIYPNEILKSHIRLILYCSGDFLFNMIGYRNAGIGEGSEKTKLGDNLETVISLTRWKKQFQIF